MVPGKPGARTARKETKMKTINKTNAVAVLKGMVKAEMANAKERAKVKTDLAKTHKSATVRQEKKAAAKKAETKRAKLFEVSGCKAVRWMFNNGISKEAVTKALAKFGVEIKPACINVLYTPGAKKFNGAKFSATQAAEIKRAAK